MTIDLAAACDQLGEITGETVTEDLFGNDFQSVLYRQVTRLPKQGRYKMTHTHRTLIKVLGLANVLVYAAAALLLWYIWPTLVETPNPVASADQAAIPSAVPTEVLSEQAQV